MQRKKGKEEPSTQQLQENLVSTPPKEGWLYLILPNVIRPNDVRLVKDAIKNATANSLNIVIDSGGGDAYSAVKIIRILRSRFKLIYGFVPRQAMSAATLMLLGTNKIYMGEESQLGPLDLPIEHPADGSTISALDKVNTLNNLGATVISIADEMFTTMRDKLKNGEKIGKVEAVRLAMQTATELVKPIASQIDPYQLQEATRSLRIGQYYAFDLLSTAMMMDDYKKAFSTATKFVHSYPDHSYAIFKEEAIDQLSLTIVDGADHSEWDFACEESHKHVIAGRQYIHYIEK